MTSCYCCQGGLKRAGSFKNRNGLVQRYRCMRCGKYFSDTQPLEGLRVDFGKAAQVVNLLCEGMGIRAASRLTGLHRDTVLNILEMAGIKFASFLDTNVRDVKAERVQIDEIFTFVYSKPQNTDRDDQTAGDFFTYLSVDRDSKLIINSHTSKRNGENTLLFLNDLRKRVPERFHLTSDCFSGYTRGRHANGAVKEVFGDSIDYATELKVWGKRIVSDLPDLSESTTCHVERTNLSVRTFTRRFTRCSIGYSKKLANLRHAVAMFVCHFNFCRKHSAHGNTPAMAAGLTDRVWTVSELLEYKP